MKKCISCKEIKPYSEFHKDKSRKPDGYEVRCKQCEIQRKKIYYASDIEKQRIQKKAWRENNPEKVKEISKKSSLKYKDKNAVYQKKYRSNPETRKKYLDSIHRWNQRNPHKVKAYSKRICHIRRSQKSSSESFSSKEWIDLCKEYQNRCTCCGIETPLSVDHVVPLCNGGSNTISNIQPLCKMCNCRKGRKTIDYRRQYGERKHESVLQEIYA